MLKRGSSGTKSCLGVDLDDEDIIYDRDIDQIYFY